MTSSENMIKVESDLYHPWSDEVGWCILQLPRVLPVSLLKQRIQEELDIPSEVNLSLGFYSQNCKLKIWDYNDQRTLDMMIKSTDPGRALLVDVDVEEDEAGLKWMIETCGLLRVEISCKEQSPNFIGVKQSVLRTCRDIHDGVREELKCLDRWNRIFTIATDPRWEEMEDEEKMQWHDKLDNGRLEGGVVVYVVWREKGEKLGWWAPP